MPSERSYLEAVARQTFLVAYDISDDLRRGQIAKVCEGYGQRVQYSLFQCDLDETRRFELQQRLEELVDLTTDRLSIFPLCRACVRDAARLGPPPLGEWPYNAATTRVV